MSPTDSAEIADDVTCISGRGPVTSRNPLTLSFEIEAMQFILGRPHFEDITIRCYMTSDRTNALANLPLPMSYARFSGILMSCEEGNDSHGAVNVFVLAFSVLDV